MCSVHYSLFLLFLAPPKVVSYIFTIGGQIYSPKTLPFEIFIFPQFIPSEILSQLYKIRCGSIEGRELHAALWKLVYDSRNVSKLIR